MRAINTLTAIQNFIIKKNQKGVVSCAKDIDKCPYSNIKLLN
jgi:hypothetical protein